MSLEETELNVGGVKFKGIYIAIMASIIGTISGGIWAVSEFYSRVGVIDDNLAQLEETVTNATATIEAEQIKLTTIETKIEDNNISHLQGKLAELQTMLENIGARQVEVLSDAKASTDKVAQLEKDWIEVRNEYKKMADALKAFEETQGKFVTELDNLWDGLDAATNPLN
jgi:chromosome segregation ATPase|tara:strand:- start:457 stop:966 length:510 start_codon:yes stop_codon:yes gene_type:complete